MAKGGFLSSFASCIDKSEKCINEMQVISCVMRALGPFLVVCLIGLVSFISWTHFTYLLPNFVESGSFMYNIHMLISLFLIFNIIFNYIQVIRVRPGYTPDNFNQFSLENQPVGGFRNCKKCKSVKPPRAHHCVICRRCVLKMDHHCPWVMNCVGFHNHKYFVLFIVWLWIGCFYISLISIPSIFNSLGANETRSFEERVELPVLLSFIMSACFTIVLLGFNIFNLFLVGTGQTQVEFYDNAQIKQRCQKRGTIFVNEYNLGLRKNLQIFFGSKNWWTFLLPSTRLVDGDGINFPTISSL